MTTTTKRRPPGRKPKGSGPVYEWRERANLTQQQSADILGCHINSIQRCERYGRAPDPITVAGQRFLAEAKKHLSTP